MKLYIVDSFTEQRFMGNQAGVAILGKGEAFPADAEMMALAAELKHSETAFVRRTAETEFVIRYFTPVEEVDLCGHATVALFTVLRDTGVITAGEYIAVTLAGRLKITVTETLIWMDMSASQIVREFTAEERDELYAAYGLDRSAWPERMQPAIVLTGLSDIILPVKNKDILDTAVMQDMVVSALSKRYHVTGVHMFALGDGEITAYCRNFAPLFAIPEEAATGTSNGGLTYYLQHYGWLKAGHINRFLQGETMGKPSYIYTKQEGDTIRVGGQAVIALECFLYGNRT